MDPDTASGALGEWECMECGYIEVGVETQPPQACPDCRAPRQALEFFPYGDDLDAHDGEDESFEELVEDDEPIDEK